MKYKIISLVLVIIGILVGSILIFYKNNDQQEVATRDYLIVTASGKTDYPFPLPFDKGQTVDEITKLFSRQIEQVQKQVGLKYIALESNQQIYSDIHIKIS